MNTIAARIKSCAQLKGSFVLRSGKTSDTYFDKYRFESDPILLRDVAREMAKLIPEGTEVLAGLEMGGIPVATMLSQITGLPAAIIGRRPSRTALAGTPKAQVSKVSGLCWSRMLSQAAEQSWTPWACFVQTA